MKNTFSRCIFFAFLFLACAENEPVEKTTLPVIPESFSPDQKKYAEKGLAVQKEAAIALFDRLDRAMENGPKEALKTCNLEASPIVRRLSQKHNAGIRRTTLKPRNSINNPTEFEQKILIAYQELHDAGEDIQARVEFLGNQVAYYAPIYVKDKCLQCHGEIGEDLDRTFYESIQNIYPNDKAHGFKSGDLRGIWGITFPVE